MEGILFLLIIIIINKYNATLKMNFKLLIK